MFSYSGTPLISRQVVGDGGPWGLGNPSSPVGWGERSELGDLILPLYLTLVETCPSVLWLQLGHSVAEPGEKGGWDPTGQTTLVG